VNEFCQLNTLGEAEGFFKVSFSRVLFFGVLVVFALPAGFLAGECHRTRGTWRLR